MDFNSYVNSGANGAEAEGREGADVASILSQLAGKYEGMSEDQILSAILSEAEKGRRNGTLTDADIDSFVKSVEPMLADSQRKKLHRVVEFLKKKR